MIKVIQHHPQRTISKYLLLLLLIMSINIQLKAQGCSDAGLCSIGNNEGGWLKDSPENNLVLSQSIGLGERNTIISTSLLAVNFKILSKTKIQLSTPFVLVNGSLGKTAGLGDLIASVNQQLFNDSNSNLSLTVGGKIPLSTPDKAIDNLDLPMVYQTSLGTYDLILGINYLVKKWHFSVAYQHVFNSITNEFNHDNVFVITQDHLDYFESSKLERGDDIMLRIERNFELKNSDIFLGVNPTYRINPDAIEIQETPFTIEGSEGLTLNLTFGYLKQFQDNNMIKLSVGAPLITKPYRVDGLTRIFVMSLAYIFNFKPEYKMDKDIQRIFEYQN
jgi:hypothetical protein